MNLPLTWTNAQLSSLNGFNQTNTNFFESFITQYEKKLSQQAKSLSVNNSLNFPNEAKNFSENLFAFEFLNKHNAGVSGVCGGDRDQVYFSGLSGQLGKNPYTKQLVSERIYFDNFKNNYSNSNLNNLDILKNKNNDNLKNIKSCKNFNLKEDLLKSQSHYLDVNAGYAYSNLNYKPNKPIKKEQENSNLSCMLGFLNDCRSEKNEVAENSHAQRNLEFPKNLNFTSNVNLPSHNNLLINKNIINLNAYSSNHESNMLKNLKENEKSIATTSKAELLLGHLNIGEKGSLNFPSFNEFKKFPPTRENESLFLGKKLKRDSPKTSEAKIESTDNDTDEIKKQPKIIFKNRKYVFTHKDNKAIEDSFKKAEKKTFNPSAVNSITQIKDSEIFKNYEKSNFYFNYKKENDESLFVKAVFAICKSEKTKEKNSILSCASDGFFDCNNLIVNSINENCNKYINNNINNSTYQSNYNNYLFEKEKLNGNLNLNNNELDSLIQKKQHYDLMQKGSDKINTESINYDFYSNDHFNEKPQNYSNLVKNSLYVENNHNKTLDSFNKNHNYLAFSNAEFNQFQNISNPLAQSNLEAESKAEPIRKQKRNVLGKSRKSKYRGVSKNGNQWQVLIMIKNIKRYVGSYASEELAARAYDKVAIQYHQTKAKTNFSYTEAEITQILKEVPTIIVNID